MAPPKLRIVGTPQEFQKLGNIGALENMGWAKIPTYYYDFNRFDLPLTVAEFGTEFGPNRPIFALGDVDDGTRQTNAAVGSGVNEVFLALATGVIAMGEGEGFAILGASVNRPAAAQNTPDVLASEVTSVGCLCGAVDLISIPAAQNGQHATLWWGAPTWRFIEKFFQAYRLQVIISNRFQIVDESLFDVGMTPVPPEFVGASDSNIPPMPFIRAVNDVMEAKAINNVFLPHNFVLRDADATSLCVPPPMAPVTYGHPRIVGLANRIYCFSQPILFFPGMRFDVSFQNVEDASVYTALQNSVTVNCTTPDVNMNAALDGLAGCAQVCTIPGGSVSLGVVFKGFALHPQASVEYLARYLTPGSMHSMLYGENQYLMGLLGKSGSVGDKVIGALSAKPQEPPQ